MKKPEVTVKKFLDWVKIDDYLLANGFTRDELYTFADFHRDSGNFHNGCFIRVEHPDQYAEAEDGLLGEYYPPVLRRLSEFLNREFPDAVDEYGEIDIWYWW